jgi:hypothetical protein
MDKVVHRVSGTARQAVLTTDGLALGGGGIAGLKVRIAGKLANGDSAT